MWNLVELASECGGLHFKYPFYFPFHWSLLMLLGVNLNLVSSNKSSATYFLQSYWKSLENNYFLDHFITKQIIHTLFTTWHILEICFLGVDIFISLSFTTNTEQNTEQSKTLEQKHISQTYITNYTEKRLYYFLTLVLTFI